MSFPTVAPLALDILGIGVVLPQQRVSIESILAQERIHIDQQLAQLTPGFRQRLMANLGIHSVASFGSMSSMEAGRSAAAAALQHSGLPPDRINLVIDYSTFVADCPSIWSLAHDVQGYLDLPAAFALGVRGSGCAGLHAALLVASAMFAAHPSLEAALLVAADRAPDGGRCCLPISFMADAASALVVTRAQVRACPLGRIHSVVVQQHGQFAALLGAQGYPIHMTIDARTFESKVLPLHFVVLHRQLMRAMKLADVHADAIQSVVYPNTTQLDRNGVARGFGYDGTMLAGPGPSTLGHAFANDLLINAADLLGCVGDSTRRITAWLAAGGGFSWGAAIVECGMSNATR